MRIERLSSLLYFPKLNAIRRARLILALEGAVNVSDFQTFFERRLFERRYRHGGDTEDHNVQASPQIYSRTGGVLYLETVS